MESDGQAGIGVHRLNDLGTLVVDHPVRIDLGVAVGIENDSLETTETYNYLPGTWNNNSLDLSKSSYHS
jgi:hypothetical protein